MTEPGTCSICGGIPYQLVGPGDLRCWEHLSSELSSREEQGYPHPMPLPDWAADAAAMLSDTDNLVVLEGVRSGHDGTVFREDIPVLLVARCSTVEEASRFEMQVIAMIVDAQTMEDIGISDDTKVYKLSEIARTDSNEAEAG